MNTRSRNCMFCITPPHLLRKLLESKERDIRDAALNTLLLSVQLRGERNVRASTFVAVSATGRRTVYDCRNSFSLSSAVLARSEDGDPSADAAVNRAFDGLGVTREFYDKVFDRNSIDGHGMRLDAFVHFGANHNNAGWNGQVMIFGDGDGVVFTDFTKSLDVIGHELAHGVTEFTSNLEYERQPGALNESMSDVFGSLIKQWSLGQLADEADWLIGADIFTPGIGADALRSMRSPGRAYDNELFGKDPQPDHMDGYYPGPDDNFGVHINSGIPNKAFFLTATAIGGKAWEIPGQIWYNALLASHRLTQFQEFADTTYLKAQEYGSSVSQVVADAWREVGIRVAVAPGAIRAAAGNSGRNSQFDEIAKGLTKQLESLAGEVKSLAKEVKAIKERR